MHNYSKKGKKQLRTIQENKREQFTKMIHLLLSIKSTEKIVQLSPTSKGNGGDACSWQSMVHKIQKSK